MHALNSIVGQINAELKKKGISKSELARQLGVSRQAISQTLNYDYKETSIDPILEHLKLEVKVIRKRKPKIDLLSDEDQEEEDEPS